MHVCVYTAGASRYYITPSRMIFRFENVALFKSLVLEQIPTELYLLPVCAYAI